MTCGKELPTVLPVLDILRGDVVRGVAGQRESYRSLKTSLAPGSLPLDVARGLRQLVQHDWLYVADLDALQHGKPQWNVLRQLTDAGSRLILDAGVCEPVRAERLLAEGTSTVVVALESLDDRASLDRVVKAIGGERTLFSLDLQQGQLLGDANVIGADDPQAIASWAIDAGVGGLIVLDLAGVGVGEGVSTHELCGQLRVAHPDVTLITGGGVRNRDDLVSLLSSGIDSVLIASALHDGRIGPNELAELR